jgi:multidrug resistance efflux pump
LDIKRDPPKKTKRYIAIAGGVAVVVVVSAFIFKLQPAAPPVERGSLWFDAVKRGPLVINVNAPGTLEPENPLNVTALTAGRVEELPVQPGIPVTPSTLLVVLNNPDEQITELNDENSLNAAYAALATLKTTLAQSILSQEGTVANMRTQYNAAVRLAAVDDSLIAQKLVSANDAAAAHDGVTEMASRIKIEQARLDEMKSSEQQQIDLQNAAIESQKRILENQKQRVASMHVYSPETGQLQTLGNPPLELGQYVTAGTQLARIVQPTKLKAVLRVPENQAKDISPGQPAIIDLHNNDSIPGHVTRKDPSSTAGTVTVDVALDAPLPPGTSSELAVDGTITIAKLNDVLSIQRPGFATADGQAGIFKVTPNKGEATRITVSFGQASVNNIEVKTGLNVGDSVIVSDMSQWDNTSRVRLK